MSIELPPIEVPELRAGVQAHVDAREGEGNARVETYVTVVTYIRDDGTAGFEIVSNAPDANRVLWMLAKSAQAMMPDVTELPNLAETHVVETRDYTSAEPTVDPAPGG